MTGFLVFLLIARGYMPKVIINVNCCTSTNAIYRFATRKVKDVVLWSFLITLRLFTRPCPLENISYQDVLKSATDGSVITLPQLTKITERYTVGVCTWFIRAKSYQSLLFMYRVTPFLQILHCLKIKIHLDVHISLLNEGIITVLINQLRC